MKGLAAFGALSLVACGALLDVGSDDVEPPPRPPVDAGLDGEAPGARDATASADEDGGAKDASQDANRRRVVFVTERSVNGAIGGLALADAICSEEAKQAGLPGAFVAWLSSSSNGVAIDAKSRLLTAAGWSLVDGGEVFAGPADIMNGSYPKLGIDQTARGAVVDGGLVWTGTREDGTSFQGSDCLQWTDDSVERAGVQGVIGARNATWTANGQGYCSDVVRLICFEK